MTTDRLFVILLVMLIPMTGCFGAIDNADAEDNDDETTIVNNYYYNNTTTMMMEQIEYFSNGGVIDSSTPHGDIGISSNGLMFSNEGQQNFFPYNFTTNAGDAMKIHYFYGSGFYRMYLETECSDGTSFSVSASYENNDNYVGGSHTDCEHSVRFNIRDYDYDQSNTTATTVNYDGASYSIIYSIQSVTVV
jgi:hypothetical protein